VFLIWLSGVLFFAARFGRQMLFARGLVRRATKIARGELDAILADAKATLAVRVDVNVRESSEIDIPIATGIARPTILLPAYSNEWDSSELRTVLLHELAHVKRADIWACSAAMIACGLNWFNPVVWLLSELATRDAELAADDLVLRSGVRPSSYADTLLSVVNNVSRYPHMQLAMPLARRGMLADRIHAILRESAVRSEIGSNIRSTVLIATLAVIVLVACVRVSGAPPKPVGSASPQSASHSETRVAVSIGSPAPVPRSQSAGPRPIPDRTDTSWVAGATEGLIAALNDQSPQVRGEAARSLGNLKARASREALSRLVNDPDKFVRYEALSALSALDRTR
jgi:beta-lactamase regulating signal transducer with metallopeptidase domain